MFQFEILTAFTWRCRIISLSLNPQDQVRLIFMNNVWAILNNPPLPRGYYGNAYAISLAVTTTRELCENPLEYALELVRTAKANVTEEYMRSFIDLVVTKGRPHTTIVQSYVVSNTVRVGLYMDYGWGKAVYGGLAKIFERPSLSATTFYIQVKNSRGEDGIMVPMCLPTLAMERFVKEVHSVLNDQSDGGLMSTFINSSMWLM